MKTPNPHSHLIQMILAESSATSSTIPFTLQLGYIVLFSQSQESCIDRHDNGARGHQDSTQSGREQYTPSVKRSSCQRNGYDVVACRPSEVLAHLPIGGAGKLHNGHDIQRIAPHQNNVGGFDRHIGTSSNRYP